MINDEKPIVYSCSGCSNVAQLANDIAVIMDREGLAKMSCIAGVGGDVKKLVRIAKSGKDILAIDGCRLNCVKNTLARHGVEPTWHVELTELGIKKREGESCPASDYHKALNYTYQAMDLIPVKDVTPTPMRLVANN